MCIWSSSSIKEFQNSNVKATKGHINLKLQEKHHDSKTKAQSFMSTHTETSETWKRLIKHPSSMTKWF